MEETENKKKSPPGIITGLMVFIPLVLGGFIPHIAWIYLMGAAIFGYSIYLNRKSKSIVLKDSSLFLFFIVCIYLMERLI
ncbi:hypothetical protein ACTSEZ_11500 [Metabacillus sp. JX24]|uniref:hypothetical protein n=1 Tax=Metabacillus sp. JX24 TaxID=3240759 RepID=UPI00350E9147